MKRNCQNGLNTKLKTMLHPASDFDDFPLINQQLLLTAKP
ncbi:protein of unknown function, might belong to sensor histidine kinase [Moritella yayanosii]|uniref:Uncharacterized protein n=1 Tax=Moritella yayanosii TaxID=69539 RepID=A0A330LPP9_9GAMM|nr:protein of unknown function, might belong to sensor histidine kinase [Moritella yayanosii]